MFSLKTKNIGWFSLYAFIIAPIIKITHVKCMLDLKEIRRTKIRDE
jgi:hypothetical protein